MQGFVEEVQKGPANAKPALTLLATLYGLTRVERRMAFYLAAGLPHYNAILLGNWLQCCMSDVLAQQRVVVALPAHCVMVKIWLQGHPADERLPRRHCQWWSCSSCSCGCERSLRGAVLGRGLGRSATCGVFWDPGPLPAGAHRL